MSLCVYQASCNLSDESTQNPSTLGGLHFDLNIFLEKENTMREIAPILIISVIISCMFQDFVKAQELIETLN